MPEFHKLPEDATYNARSDVLTDKALATLAENMDMEARRVAEGYTGPYIRNAAFLRDALRDLISYRSAPDVPRY